jgi:hypothetical protein
LKTQLLAKIDWPTDYELFVPLIQEVGMIVDKEVVELQFYLLDIKWIESPAVVVPNTLGGDPHAYWLLRRCSEWKHAFEGWLKSPYEELSHFGVTEDDSIEYSDEATDITAESADLST